MSTKSSTQADPALAPARIIRPENEAALPQPRNFQGIPGVAVTAGDVLHAVWYGGGAGEGPHNFTMLARSRDGGATWSGIETVIAHDHPLVRTYDPVVWTAPDGALWVFYAQAVQWWDGRAGVWAIACDRPDAEQLEWSEPRRIADGVMMNKPTLLRDGRWLLPVAGWSHAPCTDPGRPGRFVPEQFNRWGSVSAGSKVVVSQDAGASFQELASLPVEDVRFDEHMLVEKQDGSLWMLVRGIHGIIESFSRDGGTTWSAPAPGAIPHINSRFFIRRLQSGRLLLVRHQTPAERRQRNGGDQPGRQAPQPERAFLTAFVSDDDGATWSNGLLLDERGGVSYPDGDQLADGRIVIAYDFNRQEEKIIHLAVFAEEDVRAGECVSDGAALRIVINQGPWGTGGLVDQAELHRAAPTRQDPRDRTPMRVPYLVNPPGGVRLGVGRQLFVDDFLVEYSTMARVFHRPVKYPGNPVFFPETSWELNDTLPPATIPKCGGVWFDPQDELFKMWYMTSYLGQMALATSRDGIHWERPELDVVAGSNLVLQADFHPDSGTAWIDPNPGSPAERFKLMIREPDRPGKGRLGALFVSGDGIHWKQVGQTGPMGDRSTMFYNPFRERWVQSIRSGIHPIGRLRLHWEDQDFVASGVWQAGEPTFWCAADCMDQGESIPPELYNLDAVAYESVLVGLFQILKGPPNRIGEETGMPKLTELVLATSRDGFHWHRPDRNAFIGARREPGSWEYGYVEPTGGVLLVVGDELWFYYSAYAGDPTRLGGTWHVNGMYANGATGLAKLRRDGFASLRCSFPGAQMTTRPLLFGGRHLFVNANTAGRTLRVECQNPDGSVLPGFGAAECVAWCGNSTKAEIRWKDASIAQLAGRPVKFRFLLDAGDLYSFWLADNEQGASRGCLGAGGPGCSPVTNAVGA